MTLLLVPCLVILNWDPVTMIWLSQPLPVGLCEEESPEKNLLSLAASAQSGNSHSSN